MNRYRHNTSRYRFTDSALTYKKLARYLWFVVCSLWFFKCQPPYTCQQPVFKLQTTTHKQVIELLNLYIRANPYRHGPFTVAIRQYSFL